MKGVHQVDASAAVQTGIAVTIVDVLVAMHASVTCVAGALAAAATTSTATRCAFATAAQLLVRHTEMGIVRCWFRAVLTLPLLRAVAVVIGLCFVARC